MGLLVTVGLIVKGIVWLGYGVTGSYLVGTGVRYARDYSESVKNERV